MNATALKIIWLPVLTTIPQSQELSREFQQLNNNISSLPLGSSGVSKFRGVRNLNILPKLEASPRALCSHCSCSENGCLFNCDKCGSKCVTCDCSSSSTCKYNCDKCDDSISDQNSSFESQENVINNANSVQDNSNSYQPANNYFEQNVDVESLTKDCEGLKEAGLCTWGVVCKALTRQYPHCNYDCSTCKYNMNINKIKCDKIDFCSFGDKCEQIKVNSYPDCENACENCATSSSELQISAVVADLDGASHFLQNENQQFRPESPIGIVPPSGPWKPEPVLAEEEENPSGSTSGSPSVEPVVVEEDGADHFLQNLNQQFKPESQGGIVPPSGPWKPEPVLAEGNTSPSPPSIEPVLAEDGADHFLQNLNQQFKPEQPIGIVPPSGPWKPEPVVAESPVVEPIVASEEHWIINKPEPVLAESPIVEPVVASEEHWIINKPETEPVIAESPVLQPIVASEEQWIINKPEPVVAENDELMDSYSDSNYLAKYNSFSWLDVHPKASTCIADGGPSRGQTCKFPFKYQGKTYFGCAPLTGSMQRLNEEGTFYGWCSTYRDINGFHIKGPYADQWRNVGLCGEKCK